MIIEETYSFIDKDFDKEGVSMQTGLCFLELLNAFEQDFYQKHPFTLANYLHIGYSGMQIIKRCFLIEGSIEWESEIYGQDIVSDDLEVNFEANLKMDRASEKTLIYAFSTIIDEDEPLYLFRDPNQCQNSLTLKYVSDGDDDDKAVVSPVDKVLVNV